MRNWAHLKITCGNNKAQGLTELATFGSVLLVVLAFLIRQGMIFNHQQDVQMRAFRTALTDAVTTPIGNSSVVLVEDKHIPDPQDTFGVGDVVSVQGIDSAVWSNTLQDEQSLDPTRLPRLNYVINNTSVKGRDGNPGYTTADFSVISQTSHPAGFYIQLPSGVTIPIPWGNVRSFQPDANYPPQARVLLWGDTLIINAIATGPTSPMQQIVGLVWLDGIILRLDPPDGQQLYGFYILNSQAGDIDTNYSQLNTDLNNDGIPDVNSNNLQGLLPTDVNVRRTDKLDLEERSTAGSYYKSTDNLNTALTVTHKIRKNIAPDDIITNTLTGGGAGGIWQTPK